MAPTMNEKILPNAIDLSHHLSEVSKARAVSPLKDLMKYLKPGVIAMAAGRFIFLFLTSYSSMFVGQPNENYFPVNALLADVQLPDSFDITPTKEEFAPFSWLWKLLGVSSPRNDRTERITVPKYTSNKEEVSLAVALQYGTAEGILALQKFVHEFTEKVYQPNYADWTTLVHTGNTDGWALYDLNFDANTDFPIKFILSAGAEQS